MRARRRGWAAGRGGRVRKEGRAGEREGVVQRAARGVRPGRAEDVRQEEVGGDGEEQRGERGEDGGGRRISPVRALRGGGGGRGRADEGGAERAPDVELCHCPRDEVDVGAAGARVGEGEVPGVLGGALVADRGPGAGAHIEELRVLWKV